jgi:hypothetical protein
VRFDLAPRLTLPVPVAGLFTISPFVSPRLTAFSKTAIGTSVGKDGVPVEVTKDEAIASRSVEVGADFEARASRVYGVGGLGNVDAVLHSIEPRATYTWRDGTNLDPAQLPQWLGDNTPETSNLVFSLVNRLRARTVAPEGTEPFRWEFVRFTLGGAYDFRAAQRPVGPFTGELIVDPSRYFRFRADAIYDIYTSEGFRSGNTDFALVLPRFSAALGTRFTSANNTTNSFLQSSVRFDLTRYVTANFSTNWDMKTDTFVENRFGVDVRFQCWAFDFSYVARAKEQGLTSADNEIRFALYLLGVGGPFGLNQRFSGAAVAPAAPR